MDGVLLPSYRRNQEEMEMIQITALTGPHARKVRDATGFPNPLELLREFAEHDWKWKIDWSRATPEESFQWGVADLASRIMAALLHGRTVWFRDVAYRVSTPADIESVAGEVEDAIAGSGYVVVVETDDDHGVRIGAKQMVQ